MRLEEGHVRRAIRILAIAMSATMVAGCVGGATGQALSGEALDRTRTFFVEQHEKDKRNLAETIARALTARGLRATPGRRAERPADADYIVTYTDRWMWDMRMYLADLRIEVRDPKDNSLLGFGQSTQSSLKAMGQTHEDIINTALDELL